MNKYLWLLLPVATLYFAFFIGSFIFTPTIYWWGTPTLIVLVFSWIGSLIFAINKVVRG